MAFFEKVFTKNEGVDIDDFLNNMQNEVEPEEVDFYVKPINLQYQVDVENIIKELKERNIVILDIDAFTKRNPKKAKEVIEQIKAYVKSLKGDLAMLTKTKFILVPEKVKIIKKAK